MWDETLYAGSAAYYPHGRMPYPPELAAVLRDELSLNGGGRLLGVGCGPGRSPCCSLRCSTGRLVLTPTPRCSPRHTRQAASRGVENADLVLMRAEELPGGLGSFRVATFAQSFLWMERDRVASLFARCSGPAVRGCTYTRPRIAARVRMGWPVRRRPTTPSRSSSTYYLGPVRRAGRGTLPLGTASGEEDVMLAAGFVAPRRLEAGAGRVLERSEDDIVASIYSRSSSTPHLFGERRNEFERELRALLRQSSPRGRFCEAHAQWSSSSGGVRPKRARSALLGGAAGPRGSRRDEPAGNADQNADLQRALATARCRSGCRAGHHAIARRDGPQGPGEERR